MTDRQTDVVELVIPGRPRDVGGFPVRRTLPTMQRRHSERTPAGARARGGRVHGLQSWVALPLAHEETEPAFHHHTSNSIPEKEQAGARLRVIAGTAYGLESPVRVFAPTLYVHARIEAGAEVGVDEGHAERATYVVEGDVEVGGASRSAGELVVLRQGAPATVRAKTAANVMLIGGAPLDGQRHIWWNFVSSSRERIERAKNEWRDRRFPVVPGDEAEFVALPER